MNNNDKFTKIIDTYCNNDIGIQSLYENEARIMLQRDVHKDIDDIKAGLGDTIRRDIEEHLVCEKNVHVQLLIAALDEVDFERIAEPFVDNAVEDRRYSREIQQTEDSLMGTL